MKKMSIENDLTDILSNKCRICLQYRSESELHCFFSVFLEGVSLATVFTNITAVEIQKDERLPKNICSLCKSSIINFNSTISVFHETEIFLKKHLFKDESDESYTRDIKEQIITEDNYVNDELISDDIKSEDLEEENKINEIEVTEKCEKQNLIENTKKQTTNVSSGSSEYKFITSTKYTCECGDCFLYKAGFRQHVQFKHNKLLEESDLGKYSEEIKLKIPVGFPNNIEYVPSKLILRKNKLQCRICTATFSSEEEVKTHEAIHKTFVCDQCGAAFLRKNYLTDHLRIHSEERRFACKICQKTFKHRYTYTVHRVSHDVTRNFVCDTCGAGFKTRGTLRTHMRIKHSNVRNYPCPDCNLRFNLKSTLNKHYMRKHTPDRKKSFVCSKCGAAYLNKNTLTRHISEKHLGMAKYYPCTICENKMYVMKKGLRAHMLKKHGIVHQ